MVQLSRESLTYKVDTAEEAEEIIQKFKEAQDGESYKLTKHNVSYKCKKVRAGELKGEIESEWFIVLIEKTFEVI